MSETTCYTFFNLIMVCRKLDKLKYMIPKKTYKNKIRQKKKKTNKQKQKNYNNNNKKTTQQPYC